MFFHFVILLQTNNTIVLQRPTNKSIKNSNLDFWTQSRIIKFDRISNFIAGVSSFLDHNNAFDDDCHTADNANHRNCHRADHDNQQKCSSVGIHLVFVYFGVIIVVIVIISVVRLVS